MSTIKAATINLCYIYKYNNKVYYKCNVGNYGEIIKTYLVHYKKKITFDKSTCFIYCCVIIENEKFVKLVETFGPIGDLPNYEKYLLHYYELIGKIKLNLIPREYNCYDDSRNVFTIDGNKTILFDDAFSTNNNMLSIYISNNIQIPTNQLGNCSNIYLGYKCINMFERNVIDNGNLVKDSIRNTLVLDIIHNGKEITDHKLHNVVVKISENYNYHTSNEQLDQFKLIFNNLFNNKQDLKEIIEELMIYYNKYCANLLIEHGYGIFRTIENKNDEIYFGSYTLIPEIHKIFGTYYTHVTSPLRRIADYLNMNIINKILNNESKINIIQSEVDEINENTRKIKKIQSRLFLFWALLNNQSIYKGTIIDNNTIKIGNIYHKFKNELIIGEEYTFKLFLFVDEVKWNHKVKLIQL